MLRGKIVALCTINCLFFSLILCSNNVACSNWTFQMWLENNKWCKSVLHWVDLGMPWPVGMLLADHYKPNLCRRRWKTENFSSPWSSLIFSWLQSLPFKFVQGIFLIKSLCICLFNESEHQKFHMSILEAYSQACSIASTVLLFSITYPPRFVACELNPNLWVMRCPTSSF